MLARWPAYRLFPYEQRLARREIESLGGQVVGQSDEGLHVKGAQISIIAERCTYFSSIEDTDIVALSQQADVEARLESAERVRQSTRYGLHGLHEYKGKFNPQVARAFSNIADPEADTLVDPFCGSGTALIEALRLGMNAIGIDRSPIAHFIASTKVSATLANQPHRLRRQLIAMSEDAAAAMKHAQNAVQPTSLCNVLPVESIAYLEHWFTPPAFAAVSHALVHLLPRRRSLSARLCLTALSSVLRSVSQQMPEDLRIRRRPADFEAPPVWEVFLDQCRATDLALLECKDWQIGDGLSTTVLLGSVTEPGDLESVRRSSGRRVVVTSPPYATALPYIDTDRLSLVALGLATPDDVRRLERGLLGSREWNKAEMVAWEERRAQNTEGLPRSVTELTSEIDLRNRDSGSAGFRRRAVPGLLYRYFTTMSLGFRTLATALAVGERAAFIVGSNRTTAGGVEVTINTPNLLADIAAANGFAIDEVHDLETWPRYGMHQANAVKAEQALVLRRTQGP